MSAINVTISIDTSRLQRQLLLMEAKVTRERVNLLLRRGHGRAAESVRRAYYFKHGVTPAEHAVALRTEIALASDRWSPQP